MNRLIFICLILFAAMYAVQAFENDEQFRAFQDYAKKFNKVYGTPSEMLERFEYFKASIERVKRHRQLHFEATGRDGSEVYGLTKFSDRSMEEFRKLLGRVKPKKIDQNNIIVDNVIVSDMPQSIDWVSKGATTPIKNQGQCGSCWAFSTTEEIESRFFMQGGSLLELSVQQIVSCDDVDGGCNGGDTTTAYKYVEQAGGLELNKDYPYTSGNGNSGQCQDNHPHHVTVTNFTYATDPCYGGCNSQNETKMAASLSVRGPISICVNAETWNDYTGGVMQSNCPGGYDDLDHCVQAVGYDLNADVPYWLVRNSWGTDWGLSGFLKIAFGSNLCGVADEATWCDTKAV